MAEGPSLETIRELFAGVYDVQEKLPWNGLSLLYRARRDGRDVAVAVLPIDCEGAPDRAERFERYAASVAGLSHSRLVGVTGHGVRHGVPWVEMEQAEGRTLLEVLGDGPMSRERASTIARQVLDALGHGHERGLVHADLTPTNVLLGRGGAGLDRVRVVALGLAQVVRRARDTDVTGPTGKGSGPDALRYLAPELLAGDEPTARSDLYSVGALLHHMLTGAPPSSGSPESPEDARALVERAMAKDPSRRFASAPEMARAVDDWLRSLLDTGKISLEPEPVRGVKPRPAAGTWIEPGSRLHQPDSDQSIPLGAPDLEPPQAAAPSAAGLPPTDPFGAPAPGALAQAGRRGRSVPWAVAAILVLGLGAGAALWATSDRGAGGEAVPPTPTAVAPGPEPEAAPEPEPDSSSPLAGELDPVLARAMERIEAGRPIGREELAPLYALSRERPADVRPHLVLAHTFAAMGWNSDAVARYQLAQEADRAAKHDPRMLENLVRISTRPETGGDAAAAVATIYGREALPTVELAIEQWGLRREETDRLRRLRDRLR